VKGVDASRLRLHLLDKHATGLICTSPTDLRVAFSCLDVTQVTPLFETIHSYDTQKTSRSVIASSVALRCEYVTRVPARLCSHCTPQPDVDTETDAEPRPS
jgi:hypothetical protein